MDACSKTEADYLMYIASILYFSCYVPELYANYINKNANMYNIPEKVIMLTATGFAFSFSVVNTNPALISNYAPILLLGIVALLMKFYYAHQNRGIDVKITHTPEPKIPA